MALQLLSVLDKGWPFAATVLASAVAFGSLHSDVISLKQAQSSTQTDHDSIIRLEQGQKDMASDLKDIKRSLDRIEHK